jgi:hypothetical protein
VPEGGTCDGDWVCANDGRCVYYGGQCPATCTRRGGEGESCDASAGCADALFCVSGTCEPGLAKGEPCGGADACRLGLRCLVTAQGDERCGDLNEQPKAAEDQPCGLTLCEWGLSCEFQVDAESLCKRAAAVGEPCTWSWNQGQCTPDSYCFGVSPETDTEGTCTPRVADGEPCAWDDQCMQGSVCVGADSNDSSCKPLQHIGAPCSDYAECFSGYCDGAVCAAIVRCP